MTRWSTVDLERYLKRMGQPMAQKHEKALVTLERPAEFSLPIRPATTKNKRLVTAQGGTRMNDYALGKLTAARTELSLLWRGRSLLSGRHALTVRVRYRNRAGWLDLDNVLNFCLDALKGSVIVDDNPTIIARITVSCEQAVIDEIFFRLEPMLQFET